MKIYAIGLVAIISVSLFSWKQASDIKLLKSRAEIASQTILDLTFQIDHERSIHELEVNQRDKMIHDLQEQINDYINKINRLNSDINNANDARSRLQDAIREAGRREASAQTLVRNVEAVSTSCGVLAELLDESDYLAGVYAREADKSRIAGEMCEREYASYQSLISSITCKK